MKILQVLRPYTKTEDIKSIGYSVASLELMNELKKRGHTVEILSNANIDGYKTHHIPVKRAEYVEMCKGINSLKDEFDVVHIQMPSFTALQSVAKYLDPDVKAVITLHMSSDLGRNLFLNHGNLDKILKDGRYVICVSNTTGKNPIVEYINRNPNNLIVIPNIVRGSVGDYEKEYDISIVGRFTESKRTIHALEFCKLYGLRAVVIGKACNESDKEYEDKCLNIINDSPNLFNYIKEADRDDVLKYMNKSKVNLSLTESESFGLTLVESLLVGTPSITMNLPVSHEVLGSLSNDIPKDKIHRKLWGTRYREIKSLYDKLVGTRIADNDIIYLKNKYSAESVCSQYEEVYNKLIKEVE